MLLSIWTASWQNDCALSEDPDQPGHSPVWSGSSLCTQWVAKDLSFLHADREDSDQTGWLPRLIWVFAWRTCHFVGFVMRRLICNKCPLTPFLGKWWPHDTKCGFEPPKFVIRRPLFISRQPVLGLSLKLRNIYICIDMNLFRNRLPLSMKVQSKRLQLEQLLLPPPPPYKFLCCQSIY